MFNVANKWMRKLRGFLFLVFWTSELRVQQIEHLWYMDRQWRMESGHLCHSILQTVEDVFLSFVWYLNRLMKTCSLCIIWEAWVVWFGLWHCWLYKKSFMVLERGGMVREMMAKWHAWQKSLKKCIWGIWQSRSWQFIMFFVVLEYRPVRFGLRGIIVVRVNPNNPLMLLCKWFLLKQRNILIRYNLVSKIDLVRTEE